MKSCTYCGDLVGEQDYERVGATKIYVCGAGDCGQHLADEMRDADMAEREEAQMRAIEDDFGRYRGW